VLENHYSNGEVKLCQGTKEFLESKGKTDFSKGWSNPHMIPYDVFGEEGSCPRDDIIT